MAGQLPNVVRECLGFLLIEAIGLGQAKIQNLRLSAIRDEDVRWLDVSMDDPGGMSGIQGIGELRAQFQDFVAFEAPLFQESCLECLPRDHFHHDEGLTFVLADFVNRTDVGMIESGGGTRFPFESRNPDRIVAKPVRENLDRNLASQFLVLRSIHLSHATFSQGREDFVVSERCARLNHHFWLALVSPFANRWLQWASARFTTVAMSSSSR